MSGTVRTVNSDVENVSRRGVVVDGDDDVSAGVTLGHVTQTQTADGVVLCHGAAVVDAVVQLARVVIPEHVCTDPHLVA